jgi:hypothetical protein
MRRRALVLALAALAIAIPATALGDGGGSVFFVVTTPGGARGGHTVTSNLEITGTITVDFHGDEAAGCAAAHLCGVAGTVRWNPAGAGQLFAIAYRHNGKRFEQGFLSVGDGSGEVPPTRTSARVRRTGVPGSLCADGATEDGFQSDSAPRRGSSLVVRMLNLPRAGTVPTEVLRTRCAGPTSGDVAALLPARRITERALTRGRRTLDFSADRAFAAHGLAGSLHSTVVVRVARGARRPANAGYGHIPRTRKVRRRALEATYRVERVSGRIVTGVRGLGDPDLCGPLDACGVLGSVTVAPATSSGSATLTATGSTRRTRVELRRALGLAAGRRPRGVQRDAYARWTRDHGAVSSELTRDGAPACADSEPIAGGGFVFLQFSGGRVDASYEGGGLLGGTNLLRTRCPGPASGDLSDALARGSFPLRVFRHRRVTLRLTAGTGYRGIGYRGRVRPDLTIVLRRTRVRDSVFTEEVPSDFAYNPVRSLR